MNVCKAVSQRAASWNSNAKTTSIEQLKFGWNGVIFKLCLQAIDILVTVSEIFILILKIKAAAALNLLSLSDKEWAALLQSQLFLCQNKQRQHWELQMCHWTESCTAGVLFACLKYILLCTEGVLLSPALPTVPRYHTWLFLDFPPHLHSWPGWFSLFVCFKHFCCFLPPSPYKNKIKLNRKVFTSIILNK